MCIRTYTFNWVSDYHTGRECGACWLSRDMISKGRMIRDVVNRPRSRTSGAGTRMRKF